MEAKAVQRFEQPKYPTRREVLAGAASFALLNLTGVSLVFGETEENKIQVAPIFKHGEGRGATGCVVLSPPVFLSEEEGMQILREELAKHGIKLKAGVTLEEIRVPPRVKKHKEVKNADGTTGYEVTVVEAPNRAKPLKLDGIDSVKKIAVQFISKGECIAYSGIEDNESDWRTWSSVQVYDAKGAADYLAAHVKEQGKERVFFGVFYDPLTTMSFHEPFNEAEKVDRKVRWEKRYKRDEEASKEQLRQQAHDFIAWLKKQKAI